MEKQTHSCRVTRSKGKWPVLRGLQGSSECPSSGSFSLLLCSTDIVASNTEGLKGSGWLMSMELRCRASSPLCYSSRGKNTFLPLKLFNGQIPLVKGLTE